MIVPGGAVSTPATANQPTDVPHQTVRITKHLVMIEFCNLLTAGMGCHQMMTRLHRAQVLPTPYTFK
jgi:hypothetical protein